MDFYNKHGNYTDKAQEIDREISQFMESLFNKHATNVTDVRHIAAIAHGAIVGAEAHNAITRQVALRKQNTQQKETEK